MAALLVACSDQNDPLGPTPDPTPRNDANGRIVAMTRNMYIGADVDRVIAALAGAER